MYKVKGKNSSVTNGTIDEGSVTRPLPQSEVPEEGVGGAFETLRS